jgi:hypothetical protein
MALPPRRRRQHGVAAAPDPAFDEVPLYVSVDNVLACHQSRKQSLRRRHGQVIFDGVREDPALFCTKLDGVPLDFFASTSSCRPAHPTR